MNRPKGLTDRDWIETLEERIRQLQEQLAPAANLPASWGLTPTGDIVLRAILARAPHVVPREALLTAMEGSGSDRGGSFGSLKVYVSHIRTALRTAAPGATVNCAWNTGYYITAESAALIRAAIERAGAPAPLRLAA